MDWHAQNHCLYTTVIHNVSQKTLASARKRTALRTSGPGTKENFIRVQQGVARATLDCHKICSYAVDNLREENRHEMTATTL